MLCSGTQQLLLSVLKCTNRCDIIVLFLPACCSMSMLDHNTHLKLLFFCAVNKDDLDLVSGSQGQHEDVWICW